MLVRPRQQRTIVGTPVLRAPARSGFCLSLQTRVRGAHDRLPEIVEAVCRVVSEFLCQLSAGEGALVVFDDVRLFELVKKH